MKRIVYCVLLTVFATLMQMAPMPFDAARPASGVAFAASGPSVPAGGKGATEAAALEEMKKAALKKVLAQITAWSDDPKSPYQVLLGRYREFTGKESIRKSGKGPAGFFVLGDVPVYYDALQSELQKLVKIEQRKDTDARRVYVFVRFLGADSDAHEREAENLLWDRYNTRLKESGFDVAKEDMTLRRLSAYRGLDYEAFVEKVRKDIETGDDQSVALAIVGEVSQTALEKDASGVTASCDIRIHAFDCMKDFSLVSRYEGSDVLRRATGEEAGKFLLEKAAITSSKAIANQLIVYWKEQRI